MDRDKEQTFVLPVVWWGRGDNPRVPCIGMEATTTPVCLSVTVAALASSPVLHLRLNLRLTVSGHCMGANVFPFPAGNLHSASRSWS
ncbi:hypothetical protein J6590_061115 [Homalodisca vitripennis]|nr:hypothetical protein J6590_061115 [Homalodisca vitripennis]